MGGVLRWWGYGSRLPLGRSGGIKGWWGIGVWKGGGFKGW